MILVTGATGTVGRPLADALVGAGADVRAVSRDPRDVDKALGRPSRTYAEWVADHTTAFRH